MPLTPAHTAAIAAAAAHRAAADRAAARARRAYAEAVETAYRRSGCTERELAEHLGVSQQRAAQIVAAGRATAHRLY